MLRKQLTALIAFAVLFVVAARYCANVERLRLIEEKRLHDDIKAIEMEVFRMALEQRGRNDEFLTK